MANEEYRFRTAKGMLDDAKALQEEDPYTALQLSYGAMSKLVGALEKDTNAVFKKACTNLHSEAQDFSWMIMNSMISRAKLSKKKKGKGPTSNQQSAAKPPDYTGQLQEEHEDYKNEWIRQSILKGDQKFKDVIGMKDVKEELFASIIYPFGDFPDKIDVASSRGLLLYGPPGTGKTYIVEAAANETKKDVTVFNIRLSELLSKYYGETSQRIRAVFEEARKQKYSIIFLDEIDAISKDRSKVDNDASARALSTLLTEIAGADNKSANNVMVIGATNRPEVVDTALKSRLDRLIHVEPPSEDELAKILYKEIRSNITPARAIQDIDMRKAEQIVEYLTRRDADDVFTGRDMEKLSKRAGKIAQVKHRSRGYGRVLLEDFYEACDALSASATKETIRQYEAFGRNGFQEAGAETQENGLADAINRLADVMSGLTASGNYTGRGDESAKV